MIWSAAVPFSRLLRHANATHALSPPGEPGTTNRKWSAPTLTQEAIQGVSSTILLDKNLMLRSVKKCDEELCCNISGNGILNLLVSLESNSR